MIFRKLHPYSAFLDWPCKAPTAGLRLLHLELSANLALFFFAVDKLYEAFKLLSFNGTGGRTQYLTHGRQILEY